jgi:DNA polymerase-3 subunit epsilon
MNLFNNLWQALHSTKDKPPVPVMDPNSKLFTRVPEQFSTINSTNRKFHFAIIELETLGSNPKIHPILEIGILKGSFTAEDGITHIIESYGSLNDPLAPLPDDVSRSLGITQETISSQFIDWLHVLELIKDCDLMICHNSRQKRSFLEIQTPDYIQDKCKEIPFACLIKDIDWSAKGLDATNIKLLNYDLGFFFDTKQALTHCWANLNILTHIPNAFTELKMNVKKRGIIVCIVDTKLDRNSLLKLKKYAFTNGSKKFPTCWWAIIQEEELNQEMGFLANEIFSQQNIAQSVTCYLVPSKMKHSSRFKEKVLNPHFIDECWILSENEVVT